MFLFQQNAHQLKFFRQLLFYSSYIYSQMYVLGKSMKLSDLEINLDTISQKLRSPSQTQRFQISNHDSSHNHKHFYSPQYKKPTPLTSSCEFNPKRTAQTPRIKKMDTMLFTIQQNYYSRKNPNIISPRPPKYRSPTQKTTNFNQIQSSECSKQKQKRVVFTQKLVKESNHPPKKDTSSHKSIIKNGNTSVNDNLSSSSKSISIQNSFVSQFKVSTKIKQRPRTDSNKQRYAQIMSHFQSQKTFKNQSYNRFSAIKNNQKKQQKYTDNIFPPVISSIFLLYSQQSEMKAKIEWRRLSQLFQTQKTVLIRDSHHNTLICANNKNSLVNEYIVIALNALKYSHCILQRIFEQQKFNEYGLYLLKTFQQNNWKSIIMDDYVPFKQADIGDKGNITPCFINVRNLDDKELEIWPFLLQKAYANYYSAYQMLQHGNMYDFLNEVMGLVPLQIKLKKRSQKQYNSLKEKLKVKDSFAITQNIINDSSLIIRAQNQEGSLFKLYYSLSPNFYEDQFTLAQMQQVKNIYYYSLRTYHTLSTATIGKYSPTHKNQQRSDYSLRKLIVYQATQCLISIQQKESRFFCKSSNKYSYMWLRAILVQREFNGYQWIDGNYTNNKSNILSASLTPGEYYLIIMPQWKQTQNFELTLLVWANHLIKIERQKGSCEEMIQEACMDLAQRKGKINQLGSTLCSYNYLCPKTGLIIQNINNEKLKQEVSVYRKVSGIPSIVSLLPINKQFWNDKQLILEQVQIRIPKLSSYTIVLKMRGGLDKKLIKLFSNQKQK